MLLAKKISQNTEKLVDLIHVFQRKNVSSKKVLPFSSQQNITNKPSKFIHLLYKTMERPHQGMIFPLDHLFHLIKNLRKVLGCDNKLQTLRLFFPFFP